MSNLRLSPVLSWVYGRSNRWRKFNASKRGSLVLSVGKKSIARVAVSLSGSKSVAASFNSRSKMLCCCSKDTKLIAVTGSSWVTDPWPSPSSCPNNSRSINCFPEPLGPTTHQASPEQIAQLSTLRSGEVNAVILIMVPWIPSKRE